MFPRGCNSKRKGFWQEQFTIHTRSTAKVLTSVTNFTNEEKQQRRKRKARKLNQRRMMRYKWSGGSSCTLDGLQPLRVLCDVTLSNHSIKLSILQRHLKSHHKPMKGRSVQFFSAKRQCSQYGNQHKKYECFIEITHASECREVQNSPERSWGARDTLQQKLHQTLPHKVEKSLAVTTTCKI